MKTVRLLPLLCSLATAYLISTASAQSAADEKPVASKESSNSSREDLGYDVFDGKTNRVVRVVKADPRFVWVVYEDGNSGRKIPRTELPPQLQAKYPYDAEKAAEHVRTRAKEGEALRAEQRVALEQKERVIQAQIDALDRQRAENEKEIHNLNRKLNTTPHSKTLKGEKIQMINKQDEIRERRTELTERLKQVRAQLDNLR